MRIYGRIWGFWPWNFEGGGRVSMEGFEEEEEGMCRLNMCV